MAPAEERNDEDGPPQPSVRRVMTNQGNKAQRLLRVDQIYSRKDRQVHFVKTAKPNPKPDRQGKTALVVRRIISKQGMLAGTEIDIKSELLGDLFLDIFADVEDLTLNKTPPVASPELMFYARPHLIKRKSEEKERTTPNQALIDDIGTALRFVQEDYESTILSLDSLLANREITWDLIWAICPPKATFLAPRYGLMHQMQAFYVTSSSYDQRPNNTKYFGLYGKIITHDGSDFGWGNISIEINQFEGARPLTSLDAFPLEDMVEFEAVRDKLVARGRKYVSIVDQPNCLEYAAERATNALGIKETALPDGKLKAEKFNAAGRVIADPEAFATHNPSSNLIQPYVFPRDFILIRDLKKTQLLFCAHWINGFSLPSKTWGQLMVEYLVEIKWNDEAFQKLVMKEDRRRLIHGLVKAHKQDGETFDDFVQGKGRGLVCLLAGPPGVGKTLTAEVVAETTRRPLYVVSIGELGIDADVVDRRLVMILEITRRWGCVLLIDEADVFLSVRGQNLEKDTLVSIFLRHIEYFRGILILTTNRHSIIDPAFTSRIHFTIKYPDLDEDSRAAVWRNFIVRATQDQESVNEQGIARLAKRDLNGRQIKNTVSCAVSLARDQKKPLTVKDIEYLLDIL